MPEETNFEAAKAFVRKKRKQGKESLSGPGSHLANTEETIDLIQETISKYNIKSILDLGCGDWNWFQKIDLGDTTYLGWDADDLMIQENSEKYGRDGVEFDIKDIVAEEYPEVDLIICRDVLFHLDPTLGLKVVEKAKKSCKYFISTSFRNAKLSEKENGITKRRHLKIQGWGAYRINLNNEPFSLSEAEVKYALEKRNSKKKKANKRYICLYKF
jgi:SAM-dependent methyltransferase